MKKKPSALWVVLAYLLPLLGLVALGALAVVVFTDQPSPGTRCPSLGTQYVRKQDGVRLQCIKNSQTGHLFWRVVEERK